MTHRTLHGAKSKGHGTHEKFEKWLRHHRIAHAARAPYSATVKVPVLRSFYSSSDPHKTLRAMKALFEMAKGRSFDPKNPPSMPARNAFFEMAIRLRDDETAKRSNPVAWAEAFELMVHAAKYFKMMNM